MNLQDKGLEPGRDKVSEGWEVGNEGFKDLTCSPGRKKGKYKRTPASLEPPTPCEHRERMGSGPLCLLQASTAPGSLEGRPAPGSPGMRRP